MDLGIWFLKTYDSTEVSYNGGHLQSLHRADETRHMSGPQYAADLAYLASSRPGTYPISK